MTPDNDIQESLGGPVIDKILDHNRLQLSALLDGELSPHEARFLLRRLQHDPELAACWDRWNLCGDVLRGRVEVMASSGFSQGVAAALAAAPVSKPIKGVADSRRLRWGGGAALAASVAMIALFLGRQSPNPGSPALPPAQVVASTVLAPPPSVKNVASTPAPSMPGHAAELASVLAVADVPRRLTARRSRGQSQRAAMRTTQRSVPQAPIAMASAAPQTLPQTDPFSTQRAGLVTRPWPRALLPGTPANGAFTVDYGTRSGEVGGTNTPSFYPFEPRVPVSVSSTPRSPP
ncbi:MAG: RseA family anti-sigma factor [Luteimonas sp.]